MSWSISTVGTPEQIIERLENYKISDAVAALEYESAKPHIIALVAMNKDENPQQGIDLSAHGHQYRKDDKKYGTCSVTLKSAYLGNKPATA